MRMASMCTWAGCLIGLGLANGCGDGSGSQSTVLMPNAVPNAPAPTTSVPSTPTVDPNAAAPPVGPSPQPAVDTAGNGAMDAAGPGSMAVPAQPAPAEDPSSDPSQPTEPKAMEEELALDECGLDTGWAGDEYCILPPPPDKGFQVHIGPDDYDNPDPRYVVQPGQETNQSFDAVSGNKESIYYYYRQYRARPGTHHVIVTARDGAGGGFEGRRLGGTQNLAKDTPRLNHVPPESEGVGMALGPNTPISVNMHYINVTEKPIIQEVWINFWYKDAAEVTEPAEELYAMGGLGMAIQPGEHTTLGPYSCDVNKDGRILTMYGHYHANTIRFSAYRVRGGQRDLVYEAYDWHEPPVLEFNTITENRPPDPDAGSFGGWTDILDVKAGDRIEWECEVKNETDGVLRFTNEVYEGEMCILVGDAIGPSIRCALP